MLKILQVIWQSFLQDEHKPKKVSIYLSSKNSKRSIWRHGFLISWNHRLKQTNHWNPLPPIQRIPNKHQPFPSQLLPHFSNVPSTEELKRDPSIWLPIEEAIFNFAHSSWSREGPVPNIPHRNVFWVQQLRTGRSKHWAWFGLAKTFQFSHFRQLFLFMPIWNYWSPKRELTQAQDFYIYTMKP